MFKYKKMAPNLSFKVNLSEESFTQIGATTLT